MIEVLRLGQTEEFLREYMRRIRGMREAINNGQWEDVSARWSGLLAGSEKVAELLGRRNIFGWKPPGEPLSVSIPRELVSSYLTEVRKEPRSDWTLELEASLQSQLVVTERALERKRRRHTALIFFPPYWPFGIAGLIVELFAFMLTASRLLPESATRSPAARVVGGILQWFVTGLELWGFYRLFQAGQLF